MNIVEQARHKANGLRERMKRERGDLKRELETIVIASNLAKLLPKEIQALDGSVDYERYSYQPDRFKLYLFGGAETQLMIECYGFVFGKPKFMEYSGKFYTTAELGSMTVSVFNAKAPPGCKITSEIVHRTETRYKSSCKEEE